MPFALSEGTGRDGEGSTHVNLALGDGTEGVERSARSLSRTPDPAEVDGSDAGSLATGSFGAGDFAVFFLQKLAGDLLQ